jgi:hypothetical protein
MPKNNRNQDDRGKSFWAAIADFDGKSCGGQVLAMVGWYVPKLIG